MKYILLLISMSLLLMMSCENSKNPNQLDHTTNDTIQSVSKPEPLTKYGIDITFFDIQENIIKQNQTMGDIFSNQNIAYNLVLKASELDSIFDIRKIKTGNLISYLFTKNDTNSVRKPEYIVYEQDLKSYVVFDLRDSLNMYLGEKETKTVTREVSGKIQSSLWNAMKDIDVNPVLSIELSEVYAWSIDFFGLQKGDHFSIIYEESYIDSTFFGIDKIDAIRFDHSNHYYYAFRFKQDSIWNFFDEDGNSLRKAFLKAPLRYSRISSRYSNSRYHPVLKIRRPHHGVDYAAPKGTPIHSIGDGRVIFVGRKGGYGRRVEVKHNSVYTSGYAHMSRYAKGIKSGDFVKQGQLIGYVGMSGTATGPHLDFRVYMNGKPIDPLKMKSPPVEPIREEKMVEYKAAISNYQSTLDSLINIIHKDSIR